MGIVISLVPSPILPSAEQRLRELGLGTRLDGDGVYIR